MMVDTTVYGWYRRDAGEVICARCAGLDYVPDMLADSEEWTPLYSIEDTEPSGMSCDGGSYGCTGWVFEPDPDYCFGCDTAHWSKDDTHDDGSPVERNDDGSVVQL